MPITSPKLSDEIQNKKKISAQIIIPLREARIGLRQKTGPLKVAHPVPTQFEGGLPKDSFIAEMSSSSFWPTENGIAVCVCGKERTSWGFEVIYEIDARGFVACDGGGCIEVVRFFLQTPRVWRAVVNTRLRCKFEWILIKINGGGGAFGEQVGLWMVELEMFCCGLKI